MKKMYLHCGSTPVEYANVQSTATPAATQTHHPIPHHRFVDQVEESLTTAGLTITERHFGLNHEGNDLFGLMNVERTSDSGDNGTFQNVVGIRNSHIKHFSAGLVAGSRVFVCDNLAFSGEVKMNRKHTTHIMRDLPNLIDAMIQKLTDKWLFQEIRYEAYGNTPVDEEKAKWIIGNAVWNNYLPGSKFNKVRDEFLEPSHEVFESRDCWSLFNAFTEVAKQSPRQLPERTIGYHKLFDEVCKPAIDDLLDNQRDPVTDAQLKDINPEDYEIIS